MECAGLIGVSPSQSHPNLGLIDILQRLLWDGTCSGQMPTPLSSCLCGGKVCPYNSNLPGTFEPDEPRRLQVAPPPPASPKAMRSSGPGPRSVRPLAPSSSHISRL